MDSGQVPVPDEMSFLGARVPRALHREFKAVCVRLGLEIQDVLATILRLFIEDEEFREKIIEELEKQGVF